MSTEARHVTVSGIKVEVVRKDIKNLHLGVYLLHGRIRVAAPLVVSDEAVRLAVIEKLGWIERQKAKFAEQPRQTQREMVNGESHYFLGQRYRLRVHEQDAPAVSPCAVSPALTCSCAPGPAPSSVKQYCCIGIESDSKR